MKNVVIATTTMYKSTDESRFKLVLTTVSKARENGYRIVTVDKSEDKRVRDLLAEKKALVLPPDHPLSTMGADRRKAFTEAAELSGPGGVIVWMEPEKHTFVWLIDKVVNRLLKASADLVIPRRRSLKSYSLLQQHSESFGNDAFRIITGRSLDVYFGPQVFRSSMVNYYLDYGGDYGDKWDSIQVSVVRMIADGKKIAEIVVDYVHPEEQRTDETLEMLERRFAQITILKEAVKQEAIRLKLYSP